MKRFHFEAEIASIGELAAANQTARLKRDKATAIVTNGEEVYNSHIIQMYMTDDLARAEDYIKNKLVRKDKTTKASFATIEGDIARFNVDNVLIDRLARNAGVAVEQLARNAASGIVSGVIVVYELGDEYTNPKTGVKLPVDEANARIEQLAVTLSNAALMRIEAAFATAKLMQEMQSAPVRRRTTGTSGVGAGTTSTGAGASGGNTPPVFEVPERKTGETDAKYARRLANAAAHYKNENGVEPKLTPELEALMTTV